MTLQPLQGQSINRNIVRCSGEGTNFLMRSFNSDEPSPIVSVVCILLRSNIPTIVVRSVCRSQVSDENHISGKDFNRAWRREISGSDKGISPYCLPITIVPAFTGKTFPTSIPLTTSISARKFGGTRRSLAMVSSPSALVSDSNSSSSSHASSILGAVCCGWMGFGSSFFGEPTNRTIVLLPTTISTPGVSLVR